MSLRDELRWRVLYGVSAAAVLVPAVVQVEDLNDGHYRIVLFGRLAVYDTRRRRPRERPR